MKVGTVVKLKKDIYKINAGAIGVCFQGYKSGAQIIWENGINDGFNYEQECEEFLEIIGYSTNSDRYVFTNVIQLDKDFKSGYWDVVFTNKIYKKINNGWFSQKSAIKL